VIATTATGCYGGSGSSDGVFVNRVAIGCYGVSGNDTGLISYIANSCYGSLTNGTESESVNLKYNMP
jgi:hypothetical protein